MPSLLFSIVLRIIQAMATRNNMGDRPQPWRTLLLTRDNTAIEIIVEKFDDADNLLLTPIS